MLFICNIELTQIITLVLIHTLNLSPIQAITRLNLIVHLVGIETFIISHLFGHLKTRDKKCHIILYNKPFNTCSLQIIIRELLTYCNNFFQSRVTCLIAYAILRTFTAELILLRIFSAL